MNKSELIKTLAEENNLSTDEAALVVNTFFDSIRQALLADQRVEIRGLGSFKIKQYQAYSGRNPKTGEVVSVAPKKLPFFRAGKELKEYINSWFFLNKLVRIMRFRIVSFFSRTVLLLIAAASLLFFSFAEAFASGSVASPSVFSSPADSALPAADDIFSNGQGSGLNATDPLLTILYNAATYGELYPCPTWGDQAYGGLARRAGFIRQFRQSGKPGLVIVGPYEFLADDPFLYGSYADGKSRNSEPGKAEARTAVAAYTLLKADVGWISPKAAHWLQNATGGIPARYHIVTTEPVARVINTPIGAVGIVLFPEGPTPGKGPTPEMERKVLNAGRALREKTLLVIGISPWGFVGERDFLPKAEGTFACILGSGEGVAFPHSVSKKNPGILWLRPDSQGRAVNVLEFLQLPAPGGTMQWREGITFNADLDFLDDSCAPSREMEKIIGTVGGE